MRHCLARPSGALVIIGLAAAVWSSTLRAAPAPVAIADPVGIVCKDKVREGCREATQVAKNAPLPAFVVEATPNPTETLADALDTAYRTAPTLQAQRYQLRASDEAYMLALSEIRPSTQIQVKVTYDKTVPGRTTQATRYLASSKIITSNTLSATASISQPLYTGGKATADREAALAEMHAGRAQLRGSEGNLLLQVITTYADVLRDEQELRLYSALVRQLEATFAEVKARRDAGELTRTDIAQAETQLISARTQSSTITQQLEQDRAAYAQVVGHEPGTLAPVPPLPNFPASAEDALTLADELNPELDQAVATERQSRAQIAAARAQGHATLSLNGSAALVGQALPYVLRNQDQEFQGQAVLTVPITTGGRVHALVAQAEDRDAASRIGIETARRQMLDYIVIAWNGVATAQRNITLGETGLAAAKIFDDGTFEEYRAGLRSTFDVLYAHSTRLNAEVTLVTAHHDLYVAQATLLRHIGMLETRSLLTGSGLYNPDADLNRAAKRYSAPLDPAIRAIDQVDAGSSATSGLQQPPQGATPPAFAPTNGDQPTAAQVTHLPARARPGTTGSPQSDRSLEHP